MPHDSIHTAQLIVLFVLLSVTAFALLARRLATPYPIVLVAGGLLIGIIPGVPAVDLNPELIFLVVLPPLLFSAGWTTSWRELSRGVVNVSMLAIGLVAFTTLGVAIAGPLIFRGFDWRIGLALGATAATTDAIAATAIARRLGLPGRITDLLENESLLNDATGLLALEFAIAIVVGGHTPSFTEGLMRLIWLLAGGAASGLIAARTVEWIERRIDDGPIEIAVSLLAPYASYLSAEWIHASGALAAVAAGLYLGRRNSEFFTPAVRLQSQSVWNSLTFLLNGFVFMLIGLQLPSVMTGVSELPIGRLALYSLAFSLLLIVLRLVWTFPSTWIAHFVRARLLHHNELRPRARETFLVGWTGMRGVIALAAAMSLPETMADGSPFPHRDLIIFLIFSVILITLIAQGLTLPALIQWLGLTGAAESANELAQARRLVLETALDHLEETCRVRGPEDVALYRDIENHYRGRLSMLNNSAGVDKTRGSDFVRYMSLSRELLEVERRNALRLRDEGRISDESLRIIEHELDVNETGLNLSNELTVVGAA